MSTPDSSDGEKEVQKDESEVTTSETISFSVKNEITNKASGSNNTHAVNNNIGCPQFSVQNAFMILQSQSTSMQIASALPLPVAQPVLLPAAPSIAASSVSSVNIIPRWVWGAREPSFPLDNLKTPVGMVIIGHTVTDNDVNSNAIRHQCRAMQNHHISQGLGDIAYNFLIGCDGEAYEGRGFTIVGAHTKGHNTTSIGIAFIGDFRTNAPPSASIEKCKALIKKGVAEGYIVPKYSVVGQCDVQSNESPGKMLHNEIHRLRP